MTPRPVPKARRSYWVCQSIGFGLYFVVTVYQAAKAGPLVRAVVEAALSVVSGVLLTHLLRRTAIRRGWIAADAGTLVPRVIGAGIAIAVVHVAFLATVELGFYGDRPASPALVVLFAIFRWCLVFTLWSAFYFGYALLEQRREAVLDRLRLEKALQAAELRALKSQLHPHFLFNSLNSVRALIHEDPARAATAVNQLARALRHSFVAGREETVTFGRELEAVEAYLSLEALRLEERLIVVREIAGDTTSVAVPVMLLQVMVENGIKHGIAHLPEGGTLRIAAEKSDGALEIVVDQPRPTTARAEEESSGIGLSNTRDRLKLLFGDAASLTLDLSNPTHATARARIPLG